MLDHDRLRDLDRARGLIAEVMDARTRVVAISAIQYTSGHRYDLARIGALCRSLDRAARAAGASERPRAARPALPAPAEQSGIVIAHDLHGAAAAVRSFAR